MEQSSIDKVVALLQEAARTRVPCAPMPGSPGDVTRSEIGGLGAVEAVFAST